MCIRDRDCTMETVSKVQEQASDILEDAKAINEARAAKAEACLLYTSTLRNLRTQLFTHMESLPISYFDTHPHGDIMSVYTNDVDTQMCIRDRSFPAC